MREVPSADKMYRMVNEVLGEADRWVKRDGPDLERAINDVRRELARKSKKIGVPLKMASGKEITKKI